MQATPQTEGEEVKLIFELLDADHSGKIDVDELKRVLLSLSSWDEKQVEALIDQFDKNKDGELSIVEFWSWVNGHDGRSTENYRPALLDMAVAENKRKISETEERLAAFRDRKAAEDAKAAAEAQRQLEREQGLRLSRDAFVKEKMEAGFSKKVAEELYSKCDQDRDGEVNHQDIGWLVSDTLATLDQVKATYQKGIQREAEEVSWSEDWKAEVSKLLKKRGFKEEEEGLKYHTTNASGEEIAIREILKDKTATLESKYFPISLHLEASNVTVADCDDKGLGQLVDTFLAWDKDGDGTVSADELKDVLQHVNPKFTEVTLAKMMGEIDVNGDGVIDIQEFVSWLSGENLKKKKMKKKAKEEQDAKICFTLHRKRSDEAKDQKKLDAFMSAMSSDVKDLCIAKKLELSCGTVNAGSNANCSACGARHSWVCHGCGFVSFFKNCVNDCDTSSYGWFCISGKCPKKKCGCKKKPDFWQRSGFTSSMEKVSLDVEHLSNPCNTPTSFSSRSSWLAVAASLPLPSPRGNCVNLGEDLWLAWHRHTGHLKSWNQRPTGRRLDSPEGYWNRRVCRHRPANTRPTAKPKQSFSSAQEELQTRSRLVQILLLQQVLFIYFTETRRKAIWILPQAGQQGLPDEAKPLQRRGTRRRSQRRSRLTIGLPIIFGIFVIRCSKSACTWHTVCTMGTGPIAGGEVSSSEAHEVARSSS